MAVKKASIIFLSIFTWINLIPNLYAQTGDNQVLSDNYDSNLLEVYLDKADIQQNQEDWFRLAEYGIEAVVAKWEQEVVLINGENIDVFSLKKNLESDLNKIVEARLTRYLTGQFFKNLEKPEIGNLLSVLDKKNLEFLYQVDEDGKILTDSEGSPLYKESAGLFDITEEDAQGNIVVVQEGDQTKWSQAINASIDDVLTSWESRSLAAYSEILAKIDPELREEFEANYNITFEQQKSGLRRELDHLYLAEQNRFIQYRLYDKNSLEFKTEQGTAANVSQQLIKDTQTKLNEGIDSLMNGLNEEVGMVQTEGGVIDSDHWQESFRLLMEQGLSDWDAAEEKLLMERIEWERNIGDQMQAGEEAWAEAFHSLQDKRNEWFDKFRATLEEGNQLWAQQSQELEIAINEAIVELDVNIENRKASLQNRVDNLMGMLLQSVNMIRTSRSSWTYWMDKADSDELGTFDSSEVGYDVWSMRSSVANEFLKDLDTERNTFKNSVRAMSLGMVDSTVRQKSYESVTYYVMVSDGDDDDESHSEKRTRLEFSQSTYDSLYNKYYSKYYNTYYEIAFDSVLNKYSTEDQAILGISLNQNFIEHSMEWFKNQDLEEENFWDSNLDAASFNQLYSSFTNNSDASAKEEAQKALNSLFSWFRGDIQGPERNSTNFKEAIYWTEEVFHTYTKHSEKTQNQLASTYGIVVFNDPNNASAFTEDGDLQEALLSTDLLYDDDLWESLYLDDFQVELLKSKAYEQYWSKQVEIAKAVVDYAEDNSSEKATSDETLAALNNAEGNYNTALEEYEQLVAELQKIGDELKGNQENIAEIQKGISDKQDALSEYRKRYQDLVNQFIVQNPDYLKDKYQSFYKELLVAKGLDPERDDESMGSVMEEYLTAAHKYNLENQVSLVSRQLEVLLNGAEDSIGSDKHMNPGLYSLSELNDMVSDIKSFKLDFYNDEGFYAESDFFTSLEEDLHLSMNDYHYMEFTRLWSELISNNNEDNRTAYKMLYLVEQITKGAEDLLENRMAEIRLLGSDNFESWFNHYYDEDETGQIDTDADRLDYALNVVASEYSEKDLIGSRIEAEYNFLNELLTTYNSWDGTGTFKFYDWADQNNERIVKLSDTNDAMFKQIQWETLYSQYGALTGEQLAMKVKSLKALRNWWSGLDGSLENNADKILDAQKNSEFLDSLNIFSSENEKNQNNYISHYLEGGGLLATEQGDFGKILVSQKIDGLEKKIRLGQLLEKHQYTAISLKKAVTAKAWNELSDFLKEEGLVDDELTFLSSDNVWSNQEFTEAEQVYTWMRELEDKAEKLYMKVPDYVAIQLQDYIKEIRDFMAVSLVYNFSEDLPDSTELLQDELEKGIEKNGEMIATLNTVQGINRSEVNKLLSLEKIVAPEEELYDYIIGQLVETVALDLASKALSDNRAVIDVWEDYLDLQNVESNEIDTWKTEILNKSGNYLVIAKAIENPDSQDLNNGDPEIIKYVQTAYWNAMGVDNALESAQKNPYSIPAYYKVAQMYEAYGMEKGINGSTKVSTGMIDDIISNLANESSNSNIQLFNVYFNICNNLKNKVQASPITWDQLYKYLGDSVSAGVDSRLLDLANDDSPGAGLYKKALNYGALDAMINTGRINKDSAVEAMNWFSSLNNTNISNIDIDSWLDEDGDKKVLLILDDSELTHYYKKKILENNAEQKDWSNESYQVRTELNAFWDRVEFSKSYSQKLHGNLTEYVKETYKGNLSKQLEILNQETNSIGSTLKWDDPIFSAVIGEKAYKSLNSITTLKTYNKEDIKYDDSGAISMSLTVTGGNRSIYTYAIDLLGKDYNNNNTELAILNSRKSLLEKAIKIKADNSGNLKNLHWRTLLTDDYLYSVNNLEKEGPGQGIIVGKTDDDRESRDITINTNGDNQSMYNSPDEVQVLNRTNNDLDNWYLDEQNDLYDSATYLTGSLEVWLSGGNQDSGIINHFDWLSKEFDIKSNSGDSGYITDWSWLEGQDNDAIRKKLEYSNSQEGAYYKSLNSVQTKKGHIEYFKNEMTRFSNLIYIIETVGTNSDEQNAVLKPVKDEIEKLEKSIAASQVNWQAEIDKTSADISDMGYKQLSDLYEDAYSKTKVAIETLENEKHNYSKARAIYDYATAGYLTTPDGDSQDNNNEDSQIRQDLLDTISKVTPTERLEYSTNKHMRANAAYNALNEIVNDNKDDNYNVYENDEAYAACFDEYLTTYRESLTIKKMNNVLNAAIARQEAITRKAHAEWQEARRKSFSSKASYDKEKDMVLQNTENLEGMNLVKDADGNWTVSWDAGSGEFISDEVNNDYFAVKSTDKFGLSEYEHDLNDWLRNLDNIKKEKGDSKFNKMLESWTLAMKWEDYQNMTKEEKDKYFNDMFDGQANQTTDIMKTSAREKVVASWQAAYNTLGNNGIADEQGLFDFFKLVEKSGGVSLGITQTNDKDGVADFEDLQLDLVKEEAFGEINEQLMAGVTNHRIAAGVLFGYAAIQFALAAAIWFLPWGVVFLVAIGLLYTGLGVDQVYKANIREDSANVNTSLHINQSKKHRSEFEKTLGNGLSDMEDLRSEYELEQEKLDTLKGESPEGEVLSREAQLGKMGAGIKTAFTINNQDLNSLLDKSGTVENGDYDSALDNLLEDYHNDISDEEILTYKNNSESFLGLDKAADKRKVEKEAVLGAYINAEGGAADLQGKAVAKYQDEFKNFITSDDAEISDLEDMASEAFIKPVFSTREHLMRLFEEQKKLSDDILGDDQFSLDTAKDLLSSQKSLLAGDTQTGEKGMFDYRYDAYMDVRMHEFDMMRLDQKERRDLWEDQMRAILARGQMEWVDGEKRLKARYEDWVDNVGREYKNKKEAWSNKYIDFLEDKNAWLNVVSTQSTRIGDMEVLENFGDVTQSAIDNAGNDMIISLLAESMPDTSNILGELVDLVLLDTLLENAGSLNRGINSFKPSIFTNIGNDQFTTAELMQNIKDFQGMQNEDYKQHVSRIEYEQMLDRLRNAEKNLNLQVEGANNNLFSSLHNTMRKDGYVLSGNVYKRDLVVGSSVVDGMLFEEGFVDVYNDFTDYTSDFTSEVSISDEELNNMNSEALDGLLDNAMKAISDEVETIFGDNEDDSTILLEEMGLMVNGNYDKDYEHNDEDSDDEKKAAYKFIQEIEGDDDETEQRGVDASPGTFGKHVGFAPQFEKDSDYDKSWDSNIRFKGQGEMGTIMGQFIFNKMKEGVGYNMVNRPSYEQKLWDDRGSWLEAPSFRALSDMVISIVSIPLGGAPALALKIASSAAYTVADVSNGVMTAEEGLLSFVKSSAISSATTFIPGFDFGDGVIAGIGEAVLDQVVDNAIAGTINGFNITDGKFGWDPDVLKESMIGAGALAGYVGAGVTAGLNQWNNTTALGQDLTGVFDTKSLNSLNGLAGSLASTGVTYAMTGNASFNLLNMGDFTGGNLNHGLLEFSFGKDGTGMKIGGGGANLSMSSIASAIKGINVADSILNRKNGSIEDQLILETANMYGYSNNSDDLQLGRDLFDGHIGLSWGDGMKDGTAYNGFFDKNNPDNITVNNKYNELNLDSAAMLASLLSHENTHRIDHQAGRDTYEADALMNQMNTYGSIVEGMELKGDIGYVNQILDGFMNPESYKVNEGSVDYAEIYTNDDKIGIRPSDGGDVLFNAPLIGSALKGLAATLGLNPYTDTKQVESDIDFRRYEKEHNIEDDQLSFILFTACAALSAEQLAAEGGGSLIQYMKSVFNVDPSKISSLNDLVSTTSNIMDIVNFYNQNNLQNNGAEGFDDFKKQIFNTEGFKDIEGYSIFQDKKILEMMEESGIPYEIENIYGDNQDLKNQAANELMNNFLFVSTLYQKGVRDTKTITDLYYKGVPYSRFGEAGLNIWNNSPGFAESNGWLTADYENNDDYKEYKKQMSRMNSFNFMRSRYNDFSDPVELDSEFMINHNNIYTDMMKNGEYSDLNDYFNRQNYYESELFY